MPASHQADASPRMTTSFSQEFPQGIYSSTWKQIIKSNKYQNPLEKYKLFVIVTEGWLEEGCFHYVLEFSESAQTCLKFLV